VGAPVALSLEGVTKTFTADPVLDSVSVGLAVGERVGVVGRNGGGKTTLARILAGLSPPDQGRVIRRGGLRVGMLGQSDVLPATRTVREHVLGDRQTYEWAADPNARHLLNELVGGYDDNRLDRPIGDLAGGEARRTSLARVLLRDLDVLVLDEPTNHLDVEAVAWLAEHLRGRRRLSVVLVTHDRWFLDAVCDRIWDVGGGRVETYLGGYTAYVAAKAERARVAGAREDRRQNLLRKELAWLRRGARARTSKSKARLAAVDDLVTGEPHPGQEAGLLSFGSTRLGKTVVEVRDVSLHRGDRAVLEHVTWGLARGDRVGVLGPNGAGKTSLVLGLLGELRPQAGRVVIGSTVRAGMLSQHVEELDGSRRVLEAVTDVAARVRLADGREVSASTVCERLGFGPDRQWTPVADLSGGERRRLQLTRLLMTEPNLLVLDEPTNDLDVETLTAVEDLLDSYTGTLLVVSHDRYFLERTCERMVGLLGDGRIRDLPAGVEEYVRLREATVANEAGSATTVAHRQATEVAEPAEPAEPVTSQRTVRALRKDMARLERQLTQAETREQELHEAMVAAASNHEVLRSLQHDLDEVVATKERLEAAWLDVAVRLD
jgi:ATP-binding cassette subfamily F protein uup